MAEFTAYHWPGNVRELKNVIERGVITSSGPELELQNWRTPLASGGPGGSDQTLESIERQHILDVLKGCDWQVSGEAGAARVLGLKRTTLRSRMNKLGIEKPAP